MQTYVAKKVNIANLASELRRVCDSVADDKLLRRQCVHGVGHGFLTLNYLPIAKAVEACRDGFRGSEIDTCLGGLFMENMQKYLLWPEDQLREFLPKICADVYKFGEEELTRVCNAGIGEGLMFYTGHDLDKSLALCELLPAPHQDSCQYAAIVEENTPRDE